MYCCCNSEGCIHGPTLNRTSLGDHVRVLESRHTHCMKDMYMNSLLVRFAPEIIQYPGIFRCWVLLTIPPLAGVPVEITEANASHKHCQQSNIMCTWCMRYATSITEIPVHACSALIWSPTETMPVVTGAKQCAWGISVTSLRKMSPYICSILYDVQTEKIGPALNAMHAHILEHLRRAILVSSLQHPSSEPNIWYA